MNALNIKDLFQRSNKCYELRIESEIKAVIAEDERFFVDIFDDEYYYKGLTIMKGEIFPEPIPGHLLSIKKIYYGIDEAFQTRLFMNAEISKMVEKDSIRKENKNIISNLDFSETNIRETLIQLFDIKNKLTSNIFMVNSVDEKGYSLELFKKKEFYTLEKKYEFLDYSLNKKDIIYINDYYVEGKNIKLTQLSLIVILSEEKLLVLLQEKTEIGNNYLWGKIIEKDEQNKIIRIMTSNTKILTFEKYNNNIKLGQYAIFSKFKIESNYIKLEDDIDDYSFFSSEELYFSNKIQLNLFSIIQFYFIDFNNDKNYYNKISIGNSNSTEIKCSKLELIYNHSIPQNNKLLPLEICLIKSLDKLSFFVIILQGLLNKINVLVNYSFKPSYYFEYLNVYMKEPNNLLKKVKNIKCKDKNYTITSFDNFNSSNRIRFNILNVPMQTDCEKYINEISNSISVCEVFSDDNKSNIYGIFDIREIVGNKSLDKIIKNIDYNSFYYTAGDIYDILKNDKMEDDKAVELIERYEKINNNSKYSTFLYCLDSDKEITTSELKARIGVLICHYLKLGSKKKVFRKLAILRNIQHVIQKIEYVKEQLTNSQILRIFSYLLRARIEYNFETEILLLSREKNDSAYLLAQKFILEEIDNISEFSKLFQGYLQMDSYVSHNYKINERSYSLSIEPLFIIKNHLKSNYEGFFLLEEVNSNILGWTEPRENITIINEKNLFEKSNYIDPSHISDEKDLKNCAFGISIVLRHENNSHKKKKLK